MSFLCGCFTGSVSSKQEPCSQPSPHETETSQADAVTAAHHLSRHHTNGSSGDGYASVVSLPRYTARPVSIHEKTLEAHLRDSPVSSATYGYPGDEKPMPGPMLSPSPSPFPPSGAPHDNEEVTSDVSSALSFPSSYGNTSTATRETPPPPYSPASSRPMSISESSLVGIVVAPPPMAHIAQPRPLSFRPPPEGFLSRAMLSNLPRLSIDEQVGSCRSRRSSCGSSSSPS